MLDSIAETIKAAKVVASWSLETQKEILALADEFRVQESAKAPVKKRGPKAKKVKKAKDPNAPKRKYTRRAPKVVEVEAVEPEMATAQ